MSEATSISLENTAWRLYGTGLDKLCKDTFPVPEPESEEILVRIDAVGLCFSDIKIIRAGASHPKLWWNNLDEHPLIPGHEAVFTVVKTGSGVPSKYAPGQRYLIQCDIYLDGRSCAYGYGMDGAYACYGLIDARVWRGEKKSYLLPFPENLSAVATALIEPWSCVRGAYRLNYRSTPAAGGNVLVIAMPGDANIYRAGELFKHAAPKQIATLNLSREAEKSLTQELQVPCRHLSSLPESELFDDIICCNLSDSGLLEKSAAPAARGGIVSFIGKFPDGDCRIDVGALHYQNRYYQGIAHGDFSAAYLTARRNSLKPGGTVWFPGGAGAMGQMHVELALSAADAPCKVMVTDLDDGRIEKLKERFTSRAASRKIELKTLNPSKLSPDDLERELGNFAPNGFDDVVILVPSAEMVAFSARFLNDGALVNLFAGIPAGKTSRLPIGKIVENNVRFIGSSGSTFDDMADTLQAAAEEKFQPQSALAAIGGMDALKEGLCAVASGSFPGKTAILPTCPDLPLTALSDLGELDPALPGTLDENGCYTRATEEMLINIWGKKNA